MFTGIIEELAKVTAVTASKLTVITALGDIYRGDSISVNGVCLTAADITGKTGHFNVTFDYTPETSDMTTLSCLRNGARVNIERALKANARLGGHIVSGHVESVGTVGSIVESGNSYVFTFNIERDIAKYIVQKGSIAIEGISLTVARCGCSSFSVSVIPLTYSNTNLQFKQAGDKVNIETDIIAKYIEKTNSFKISNPITADFLKKNGF